LVDGLLYPALKQKDRSNPVYCQAHTLTGSADPWDIGRLST
jgi:hypothetical protein